MRTLSVSNFQDIGIPGYANIAGCAIKLIYRTYNQRVLEVENATFTPLVFSCFGGQGFECKRFFQRINEKLADKRDISPSVCMTYIKAKLSFSLLRSALLCLRGSKSLRKKSTESLKDTDNDVAIEECGLVK